MLQWLTAAGLGAAVVVGFGVPDAKAQHHGWGHNGGHHGFGHHGLHHGFGHHGFGRHGLGHRGFGHHGFGHHGFGHGGFGHHGLGHGGLHFSFGYRPRYDSPNYDHERYDDDRYEYGLDDYEAVPGTDRYVARSRGWDLLAEGHAEEAIRVFANQAENNPRHGVPKVGYALSAAALGDLSTGVWAMRRACRYDPQAMEDMHLPDELQPTVDRLVAAYEKEPAGDADTQFMLSSLYALQGERRAAETAITRAIDRGDRRTSTVNLKRVIDSQTARAEERAPATGPPAQNPEPSAESGVSIDSKRTLQAPPKPPKPDIGN